MNSNRIIRLAVLITCWSLPLVLWVGCSDRVDQSKDNSKNSRSSRLDDSRTLPCTIDFEEVSNALSGSKFVDGREQKLFALIETTGGGLATIDIDLDGKVDVICAGGGKADAQAKEFRGGVGSAFRMTSNLQFVNISEQSKLDFSSTFNTAIVAGDYDADGFQDLVVTGYERVQFFRNQGDGSFEKIENEIVSSESAWSSAATFFDGNRDGHLDLFVVHYANWTFDHNPWCHALAIAGKTDGKERDYCGPREFEGIMDTFYSSLGDGHFRDLTEESGTDLKLRGLGVLAASLDDGKSVCLYVANDVDPNLLYKIDKGQHFKEMGRQSGVACNDQGMPEGSMGIAVGDYNLDGKLDLWVTNYQNEIGSLYRNNGNLSFTYASHAARIAATDEGAVGWGTAFSDFDLDGDEDLICMNGHVELVSSGSSFLQKPQLLENMEGKYFRLKRDGNSSGFLEKPQAGRGLAIADFDRDGLMDFGACRINDPFAVVHNKSTRHGKYLELSLVGTKSNRDAIGAVVRLKVGSRSWIRCIYGGGSYASTSERMIHFGIPSELAASEATVEVVWPSGTTQSLKLGSLDTHLVVVEGQ